MIKNIYFDYQATTPVDPRVVDKMLPYFGEIYGNPHSRNHSYGWEAEEAVEIARENVANIIKANAKNYFYVGRNRIQQFSYQGIIKFYGDKKNHIITCITEHKCVLNHADFYQKRKILMLLIFLLQSDGLIDLSELKKTITPKTLLVSIMGVHNEIGVIQPLKEIGEICRKNDVFFHTDCAQAVGKIELDVNDMNIDLMSISGHKMYGPKGVGALFVRRKPRVRISAMMSGGGQRGV